MVEQICTRCSRSKDESEFYLNCTNGRTYRKRICRLCDNRARGSRKRQPWSEKCLNDMGLKARKNAAAKKRRRDPDFLPNVIVMDSRQFDKRHGLENDLNCEWVRSVIEPGCSYCGETNLRMTLDRIDNTQGHLKANVRAACVRCNYLRQDMPFEAWLLLVPAVRMAREAGTFGVWRGRYRQGAPS